jgi:hypothetical protein
MGMDCGVDIVIWRDLWGMNGTWRVIDGEEGDDVDFVSRLEK